MSWYLQRISPWVSVSDYLESLRRASARAADARRVQVAEPEPPPPSCVPPPTCSPLADGLELCWQTDWNQLTAEVELTSAEGGTSRARLTTVRPIGALTVSGRAVKAELLAALDVLQRVIYLQGWATGRRRRVKIRQVLD